MYIVLYVFTSSKIFFVLYDTYKIINRYLPQIRLSKILNIRREKIVIWKLFACYILILRKHIFNISQYIFARILHSNKGRYVKLPHWHYLIFMTNVEHVGFASDKLLSIL